MLWSYRSFLTFWFLIKAALNERNLGLIIVNVNMGTSGKEDERNLKHFQRPKLPWLRTFLQERGIQTSLEGKGDNNEGRRPAQLLSTSCSDH